MIDDQKKKVYFSLLSGEIYEVEADEGKNLDKYQIPLKHRPKGSCRKCHGRLYRGFDTINKLYVVCLPCMSKCIVAHAADDLVVEAPIVVK